MRHGSVGSGDLGDDWRPSTHLSFTDRPADPAEYLPPGPAEVMELLEALLPGLEAAAAEEGEQE